MCGVFGYLLLHEPYSRLEAGTGVLSLLGVVLIAKPSFLFAASQQIEYGPDGTVVTPAQRNVAVFVALLGVVGAAGAYLSIRKIGERAHA